MLQGVYDHLSGFPLWVLLIAGFIIIKTGLYIREEYTIRLLGHHASIRRAYLPLSLDFIYGAVQAMKNHENYSFWLGMFHGHGASKDPYNVEATVAGRRVIFTADPENIKAILATQFNDYGKGPQFNKEWHDFLGDSIFTTDHELWHTSRQLIRPQFIKDRISDLDVFERHFQALLPKLEANGKTIDIADLFFRFTLDAATDFLLGQSVDSIHNAENKFAVSFGEVQRIQSTFVRLGPLQFLWPRGTFNKHLRVINDFVNPFIERTLRLSPQEIEEKGKGDEGYTFLHALAGHTRDRTVLRDQLISVLLAGRDTTACTLSWLFYELSNHPEVVEKLREEIKQVVGLQREPTYADLKAMKYLTHTLNETTRLYPVVPFNVRVAMKNTTLPRGAGPEGTLRIAVPQGTQVGYSTLVMQRRKDIYPPVSANFPPVETFAPERWFHWTPKPWTHIPFNGGPRLCIGQQFALTEMGYVVVRLLQRVERVESRMGGEVPKMKSEIVLQPGCGVRVALWGTKAQ